MLHIVGERQQTHVRVHVRVTSHQVGSCQESRTQSCELEKVLKHPVLCIMLLSPLTTTSNKPLGGLESMFLYTFESEE